MLETKSYCLLSILSLSLGPCSIEPKPLVLCLAVALIVIKSAMFESNANVAAHPPLLSISDNLNSLNHTSAQTFILSCLGFLTPTIRALISPKLGFPLIATLCCPKLCSENSSTACSSTISLITL